MPPHWDEPHHHHHHHHGSNRPFIEVDIVNPLARPPPPRVTTEVIIAPQPPQPRPTEIVYVNQPRPTEIVYVDQSPPPPREMVVVVPGSRPPPPEHWDNRPRW